MLFAIATALNLIKLTNDQSLQIKNASIYIILDLMQKYTLPSKAKTDYGNSMYFQTVEVICFQFLLHLNKLIYKK